MYDQRAMLVSSVFGSASIVIEPGTSSPRMPAGIEAIDGGAPAARAGKIVDGGTTSAIASTPCTSGRFVVTAPGNEASENDQPPPTARMGRCSVSACWIA